MNRPIEWYKQENLPEKVKEALSTLESYRLEESKKIVPYSYICICCRKNAIFQMKIGEEAIHPLSQEGAMWLNGVVKLINCGYGSNHDTESYYVGICDLCLTELYDKGIIKSHRDIRKKLELCEEEKK